MKSGRAAIRYAKALLEFSTENQKQQEVVEEMQNIGSVMESNPELQEVLNSPVLPGSKKRKIMDEVFPKGSILTPHRKEMMHQRIQNPPKSF